MPFQARFAPIKANLLLQLNVIVIIFKGNIKAKVK